MRLAAVILPAWGPVRMYRCRESLVCKGGPCLGRGTARGSAGRTRDLRCPFAGTRHLAQIHGLEDDRVEASACAVWSRRRRTARPTQGDRRRERQSRRSVR
jgi:hypothetical protein